jgi:hypothetical protein
MGPVSPGLFIFASLRSVPRAFELDRGRPRLGPLDPLPEGAAMIATAAICLYKPTMFVRLHIHIDPLATARAARRQRSPDPVVEQGLLRGRGA